MKGFYLTLILLFFCMTSKTWAQRSNGLTLEGVVSVEQGSVDGAIIQIYRNGQRMGDYGIPNNGRYRVELNYNYEFILIFSRKDNFSQKIVVDTNVPREVLQSDPLFPPFPVNIKLFTEIPGIDKTFSENAVQKIYYSKNVDNFISDLFYNEAQIKHLIDQAIEQSQQLGKEADNLAGLTRAELAELKKEYDRLIKEAENEYNREEFLSALDGYQAANKLFPKEQYPKDRIAEINDLLGLLMVAEEMEKALSDRLQALISRGDLMFDQKKYEEATSSYQRALSVDSENNHAQSRLTEIKEILGKQQVDRDYDALIVAADNSFDELLYAEARNIYIEALELKGGEQHPQQRIKEIDEILEQQAMNAEKLQGYKESLFQAELSFERQFYDEAIAFYENALTYKPGDEVATRKVEEIKTLMSQLANQVLYNKRIKTADKAFKKEQYEEALLEYEEAAKLMPSEQYPLSQIKEINAVFTERERLVAEAEAERQRLLAAEKAAEQARLAAVEAEKDRQYNQAVSRADSLFKLQEYEVSRQAYQMALKVKPDEPLPEQRINEIDELLVQLAAVQKEYEAVISRAETAFRQESFEGARAAFREALQVKSDEAYPEEMLVKIDSIEQAREQLAVEAEAERLRLAAEAEAAEQERLEALAAEKERQYKFRIAQADSLFELKEYEGSRTAYREALQIKPEEERPGLQINEIDKLLVLLAEAQKVYEDAVARGDDALRQESFEVAKTAFLEAQQAKPEEAYPKEMLAQVDSIIIVREQLAAQAEAAEKARLAALEAEKEKQYAQAVQRADSLFQLKAYEVSLLAYQNALQIKPGESKPTQRINEINDLVNQLAAVQEVYDAAVSRGKDAFSREAFDEARVAFLEAQQAKPEEAYAVQMVVQIDSIVESRERLAAEAEAELLRLAAEAEAAEQARLAAMEAEKNRQYTQSVHHADSLFLLKEYDNARAAYQLALQIKPGEAIPEQKISEIDGLIARLAAAEQDYNVAVTRGNEAFREESFEVAKEAFLQAQQAKSEENYPREMVAQIDSIIETRERLAAEAEAEKARLAAEAEAAEQARLTALQAEKDRQYAQRVSKADSLFNLKEFESSRSAYQMALQINGEAEHPQQRIVEVDKILADIETARLEQEKLEKEYQDVVSMADKLFNDNDYNQAKENYEKAMALKPEESYPKKRIAEADRMMQQIELDKNYQSVILAADNLFEEESWIEAKAEYEKALALKPEENYPGGQIIKIDNVIKQLEDKALAEQQAVAEMEQRKKEIERHQLALQERQDMNEAGLNQLYQEYISLADQYFNTKMYNVSRAWYYKAWDVKQDETYPPQQIDEINRLVGSMLLSQRDKDYQNFVNLADSTLRENQLAVSRGWYNRALSIKPDEDYPKEQLQVIAGLISERMAGRSGILFESHIKKAAEALENESYNVARYWYKKALELRPDDKDALEKLTKIQDALN